MSVNSFTKYQIENVTKTIDLSGLSEIQDGETISSATVEISSGGQVVEGMLVGDPVISSGGDMVSFRVKDGTVNTRYLITIVVVTNVEHVRQNFVNMTVE